LGERAGDIPRAATKVKRALTGPGKRLFDQAVFPKAVESEALEVVDEVIAGGDGVEEVPDPGGPRSSPEGVISVCHAELGGDGARKLAALAR